ncbi:hypothetical protein [Paucibacter soli]|uniref:hypothetical protein n=1 Tax=Paucibacter soli TaxID=3133433 RepID=UPI00309CDC7A
MNELPQGRVKAVQEPGYANVWSIQDEAGATVARLTINAQAETWAKRIEGALNAQAIANN